MIGFGISTHNRKGLLLETLTSVWKYAPLGSEIVIGDDCSTDGTVQEIKNWIHKAGIRNMHLIEHPQVVGISNNKADILAKLLSYPCEDIILIEDDVIPVAADWYQEFIQTAYRNAEAHLLYMPTERKYGQTLVTDGESKFPVQWKVYCSGMIMYFRKALLLEVGNFERRFLRYGWDHNELSARCLLAQWKDPGGPYPHCYSAERNAVVRSLDIEMVISNRPETSTCGTVSEKMMLANQNKKLYDSLLSSYRVQYSDVEKKTDAEKQAKRLSYFSGSWIMNKELEREQQAGPCL